MIRLEQYEWCRYWWDEAEKAAKPRVLLIGDSVTEGYRPYVKKLMPDHVFVDMLATSRGVDNGALLYEIDHMLDTPSFSYDVIHFNNGLHGEHLTIEEYSLFYREIITRIIKKTAKAKLVLATSTPITMINFPEKIDEAKNFIVEERNIAVKKIADELKLPLDDLYKKMLGKSQYRMDDGVHYNIEGQKMQAKFVFEKLIEICRFQ